MHSTWVVVADSARARIFERGARWQALDERHAMAHPESRLHAGDLRTGGRGEQRESMNRSAHSSDPATTPNEKQAEDFARDIAHALHDGRTRGEFEKLVLVAPPSFLGRLRQKLDNPTARCVAQEVDKNWARQSTGDIQGLLEKHF